MAAAAAGPTYDDSEGIQRIDPRALPEPPDGYEVVWLLETVVFDEDGNFIPPQPHEIRLRPAFVLIAEMDETMPAEGTAPRAALDELAKLADLEDRLYGQAADALADRNAHIAEGRLRHYNRQPLHENYIAGSDPYTHIVNVVSRFRIGAVGHYPSEMIPVAFPLFCPSFMTGHGEVQPVVTDDRLIHGPIAGTRYNKFPGIITQMSGNGAPRDPTRPLTETGPNLGRVTVILYIHTAVAAGAQSEAEAVLHAHKFCGLVSYLTGSQFYPVNVETNNIVATFNTFNNEKLAAAGRREYTEPKCLNLLLLDSAFEAHLRMQVFPSLTIRMKDPTRVVDPNSTAKKKKKLMTFILPRGGTGVATGGQTTAGMLQAVQMLQAQVLQHVVDTENSVRSASEYSAQHVSEQQAAALASMSHLGIQARAPGGKGKARYRTLSEDTIGSGKAVAAAGDAETDSTLDGAEPMEIDRPDDAEPTDSDREGSVFAPVALTVTVEPAPDDLRSCLAARGDDDGDEDAGRPLKRRRLSFADGTPGRPLAVATKYDPTSRIDPRAAAPSAVDEEYDDDGGFFD